MTEAATWQEPHQPEFQINGGGNEFGDGDIVIQTPSFAGVQKPTDEDDEGPSHQMNHKVLRNDNSNSSGSASLAAHLKGMTTGSADNSFHGVYSQAPGEGVLEQSSRSRTTEWKPPSQPYKPPMSALELSTINSIATAAASNVSKGYVSPSPPDFGDAPARQPVVPRVHQPRAREAEPSSETRLASRPAPAPVAATGTNDDVPPRSDSSILKHRTLDESLHNVYGGSAEMTSNPLSFRSRHRAIQFHNIAIREYARCVGDNPSCSAGPPMSISWEYRQALTMPVEIYEDARPPRRDHFELVLPRKIRQDMLKVEWNISQREIAEAVRSNVRAKNQRKATVNNLGKTTMRIEIFMESLSRKLHRLITFQKSVGKQVEELTAKSRLVEAQRQKQSQQPPQQ